ncbi:hypothetical protein HHK36_022907 [Tetracentron sinense]|uniref:Uncharacterized protein n=1 Tax=Tetracentron sinense TaxID=13715 RepID=A0A834YQD7_TETSI|nr:hypothetical protein HHK36_022907 [Tetracentron sinense]
MSIYKTLDKPQESGSPQMGFTPIQSIISPSQSSERTCRKKAEPGSSGYLGSIVPDSYLRPPSNSTNISIKNSNLSSSDDQNFCSTHPSCPEIQSQCNNNGTLADALSVSVKASNASEDFSYFDELNHGFWADEQSWELGAAMNRNPLMVEDGCMGALYPFMDNPS